MPEWDRLSDMSVADLHENSTRWDVETAAPSDDVLRLQFIILAAVSAVVAAACLLLLVSILRTPKVRQQSFNCYLLAITFPDFVMSSMCLITCAMGAPSGSYYSEAMCGFQAWYLTWAITSNCWVNATIAHQVHKMLKVTHAMGRYNPPARKYVGLQAACVYLYAAFIASVATFHIPAIPFKSASYRGFVCFPKDYDTASTIFFWLVFVPAYIGIPLVYVLWSAVDIIRKKLIPPAGRRRSLAIYFSRIVLVFIVMWLPYFLMAFIIGSALPIDQAAWVVWAACVLAHLQGLVSVILCAAKPDVKKCVLSTLTCGCWDGSGSDEGGAEEGERRQSTRFSSIGGSIYSTVSKFIPRRRTVEVVSPEPKAISQNTASHTEAASHDIEEGHGEGLRGGDG